MVKNKWERARQALGTLSATRKVMVGALIVLTGVSAVWLTQQASRRGMEPVLDQVFSDADLIAIGDHLRAKNITYELRDGRVFVPADRKLDVLSELIYCNVVTGSTESGFDAMIARSSAFDTPSKTDKMFNHAREVSVQTVIRNFPGVRRATVIIDPTNERHIGGSITPSALVDIQTRPSSGANARQLAMASVNAVTGAVSTMDRAKVKVTIDGASYGVGGTENFDDVSGDMFARRQQCEQAYVTKVRQLLSYIPDVLVSVSVDLNVQSLEEEKRIVDPLKQSASEQPATATITPETEVLANAVPRIAEALSTVNGGAEQPSPKSETVQKSRTPAGKETVLSASVAVPRSYLVNLYKRGAREPKEPDDALLQPIADAQLLKVRNLVRNALGLKNDEDVTVEVYEDATVVPAAAATTSEATVIPAVAMLKGRIREIGYAALGVLGIVAVSMFLRRSNGSASFGEQIDVAMAPARVRAVTPVRREVIDSVEEGTEDLLRQVRELAARRPPAAAQVLREWIDEE
jgi:flagellar biosynthesis/type III secretory pathway M-ring protein FliF/YscJ